VLDLIPSDPTIGSSGNPSRSNKTRVIDVASTSGSSSARRRRRFDHVASSTPHQLRDLLSHRLRVNPLRLLSCRSTSSRCPRPPFPISARHRQTLQRSRRCRLEPKSKSCALLKLRFQSPENFQNPSVLHGQAEPARKMKRLEQTLHGWREQLPRSAPCGETPRNRIRIPIHTHYRMRADSYTSVKVIKGTHRIATQESKSIFL
jgi:hypothetical protein